MKTYTPKQTIIKVTEFLERKERFAFVTYTRSSFFSVLGDIKGEKKPPKSFVQSTLKSLSVSDYNYMSATQKDFIENYRSKLGRIGMLDKVFYDSSFLEEYVNNDYEIFKIFMNRYFKYNDVLVISFQHRSNIGKFFSKNSSFIHVPYNDFYTKIDSVCAQVTEFENAHDLVVLDCPMFGSALAPRLWEQTNLSILDLGKALSLARAIEKNK